MALPVRKVEFDVFSPPKVKSVPLLDRLREAEFPWLRQHAREYAGQWVALDGSHLLGSALRLKDLLAQLSEGARQRNPLFHRVDVD